MNIYKTVLNCRRSALDSKPFRGELKRASWKPSVVCSCRNQKLNVFHLTSSASFQSPKIQTLKNSADLNRKPMIPDGAGPDSPSQTWTWRISKKKI